MVQITKGVIYFTAKFLNKIGSKGQYYKKFYGRNLGILVIS